MNRNKITKKKKTTEINGRAVKSSPIVESLLVSTAERGLATNLSKSVQIWTQSELLGTEWNRVSQEASSDFWWMSRKTVVMLFE